MRGNFGSLLFASILMSLMAAGAWAAGSQTNLANGEKIYKQVCHVCHGPGIAGAPKFGDSQAWKPRIAEGMQTLDNHAIHGFNAMPAKGGDPSLSDQDVRDAVAYMVAHGK
jgi:cytochrome c5